MPRVTGGRKGLETYPTATRNGNAGQPAISFATSATPYEQTSGQAPINIITASINLNAGSRVKVEGLTPFQGSVSSASAVLTSPNVPSVEAIQSFAPSDFRTLNFLGITDVQPAGPLTIGLAIAVPDGDGARIDSAGPIVLVLTAIPAS